MSINITSRQATYDELVAENDRRGELSRLLKPKSSA